VPQKPLLEYQLRQRAVRCLSETTRRLWSDGNGQCGDTTYGCLIKLYISETVSMNVKGSSAEPPSDVAIERTACGTLTWAGVDALE
jgi:hypothetical protein